MVISIGKQGWGFPYVPMTFHGWFDLATHLLAYQTSRERFTLGKDINSNIIPDHWWFNQRIFIPLFPSSLLFFPLGFLNHHIFSSCNIFQNYFSMYCLYFYIIPYGLIEREYFLCFYMFVTTIKISEGMGNSMMKFIVCIQMRMAEAFVLFMEKIRGRSHLKVSIPCFPGVLGERTEKGMMFTRHHSVEK